MAKSLLDFVRKGLRHLIAAASVATASLWFKLSMAWNYPGSHATWARIPAANGKASRLGQGNRFCGLDELFEETICNI
jgi:hypothetical protein